MKRIQAVRGKAYQGLPGTQAFQNAPASAGGSAAKRGQGGNGVHRHLKFQARQHLGALRGMRRVSIERFQVDDGVHAMLTQAGFQLSLHPMQSQAAAILPLWSVCAAAGQLNQADVKRQDTGQAARSTHL